MSPKRAVIIGASCGLIAGVLNAWLLLRWLGFGFWYLVVVVPMCIIAMQGVATVVTRLLLRGEPFPRLSDLK